MFQKVNVKNNVNLTDLYGKIILEQTEIKKPENNNNIFVNKQFIYCYESINKIISIKISSNMDLNNIDPPALNTHHVNLCYFRYNKQIYKFIGSNWDNCRFEYYSNNDDKNNENSNDKKTADEAVKDIVNDLKLNDFILTTRSAWDCLMKYLNISYFNYLTFILNYEQKDKQLLNDFKKIENVYCDKTLNSLNKMYECKFRGRFFKIKELKVNYKQLNNIYYLIIEYDNHSLEYKEEYLKTITKKENPNVKTHELTFDGEIIYKSVFPADYCKLKNQIFYPEYPIYKSGMKILIDKRRLTHPSIKFVYSVLKLCGLKQNEYVWIKFLERNEFSALRLIFDFIKVSSDKSLQYFEENLKYLSIQRVNHFIDVNLLFECN
ncbi:hypothetical protein ABK040_001170 [Willaertia magna]